jgi:ribose 5-phosphate isomerase A
MGTMTSDQRDQYKRQAAEAAVVHVKDGQIVGLGTGSTARYVIQALAERVKSGLSIRGVPTSHETAELARRAGIPLMDDRPSQEPSACDWDGGCSLDVAIDGADQVDPQLNLIKGGGGALLKEKIVASAARQLIIVVDDSKRVPILGGPMPLPIEVVRFGWGCTARQIERLGGKVKLREREDRVFVTEAGHYILDLYLERITEPEKLETEVSRIPGVVETGLFVNRTNLLVVGTPRGVEIQEARSGRR